VEPSEAAVQQCSVVAQSQSLDDLARCRYHRHHCKFDRVHVHVHGFENQGRILTKFQITLAVIGTTTGF
jgi:hypothetical protein